jgi:hypothetical protein
VRGRHLGEADVSQAERARIASQVGDAGQHLGCRGAPEQERDEAVLVGAQQVDVVLGRRFVIAHRANVVGRGARIHRRRGLIGRDAVQAAQGFWLCADAPTCSDRLVETAFSHFHPVLCGLLTPRARLFGRQDKSLSRDGK